MDEAKVREIADGRVYSAQQALELGIIDRIGTLRDALACLKEKIGAKSVRVVTYQRPMGWKPNIYAEQPYTPAQLNLFNLELGAEWLHPEPRFMYLWSPGS
jgi:protease-4